MLVDKPESSEPFAPPSGGFSATGLRLKCLDGCNSDFAALNLRPTT